MPTYNQDQFIEPALNTVVPQVDALVIVDDGSRDKTTEIVKRWCIENENVFVVTHEDNRGTAEAINSGQESLAVFGIECDWLTWVSSDNTYVLTWMQTLMQHAGEDAGVVYSGFWWEKPACKRYLFVPYTREQLIRDQNCMFGPSFVIRHDVWSEAGPHRGRISHDYDHWLRVEEICWRWGLEIVGVDEPLCHYNAHDARVTITRRREYDAPKWQREARKRRGVK
jgi:glycosyltransferase involved in cell wall biosynthesis